MHTAIKVKAQATALRKVLGEKAHKLSHSQCLEIVSKIDGYPDWNTHIADINKNQQRAEKFLDEMIEAEVELSHAKFTQRFEEKYLVNFTESDFLRDMKKIQDIFGSYVRREFLGCLAGEKRPGDDRYPNQVRYVWRGFFEKNDALITVGIYHNRDTYHVCEARYH